MGHRIKLKIMIGILKGKISILKASLSTKRSTKILRAVLRATTPNLSAPSSDNRVAAVLSFGHGSGRTACACIEALMDRLHGTKNAAVVLKCLFTIHSVITKGSFILKDQLSSYPSFGGRNFLNLSTFRDKSDSEMLEFSSWARWYAAVIEQNLTISRVLGQFLYSSSSNNNNKDIKATIWAPSSKDLLGKAAALVDFVKVICEVPDSLHLQKNDLVYEVVRLVSEDYRLVQHEIFVRAKELGGRIPSLSFSELNQLLGILKRFEDCKEKLRLLFVNRCRNDALWELIIETEMKIIERMKEMGDMKMLVKMEMRDDSSQLTRFGKPFAELERLVHFNSGGGWLDLDGPPFTVSTRMIS